MAGAAGAAGPAVAAVAGAGGAAMAGAAGAAAAAVGGAVAAAGAAGAAMGGAAVDLEGGVGGAGADVPRLVKKEWRVLYGKMASCDVLSADHRCNVYCDGPKVIGANALGAVHSLPSIVRPKPEQQDDVEGNESGNESGNDLGEGQLGNEWYDYAVLMQDVQATALTGTLNGRRVFLPYRPMSRHG